MGNFIQTVSSARIEAQNPIKPSTSWQPYVELMRIKVFTTVIMYSPYLYGSLFAACISTEPVSLSQLLWINMKLLLSALLSHSWACTWNDVADCDLDRQVERCCNRPIARGVVTPQAGFVFTIAQIIVWLQYHAIALPQYSTYGIIAGTLAIFYPFSKRVTNYTPVLLGVICAWGTLLGFVSTEGDLTEIAKSSRQGFGLIALSAYTWAWVTNFETIYAFQDLRDDMKGGIKSMAVQFRHSARLMFGLSIFIQMVLLVLSGRVIKAGFVYYLLVPFANTCLQLWTQFHIDINKPTDCASFFKRTPMTTSALISTGLACEYLSN